MQQLGDHMAQCATVGTAPGKSVGDFKVKICKGTYVMGALIAISWELWNRVFFRETKLITGKIQHCQRAIQGACRCEGGFGRSPVAQLEKMSCLERGVTQKRMKWKAVLSPVPLKAIGIGVFIDCPLIFLICWISMMFSSPFGGWSIMVDLIPLGRGLKVSVLGPKFGGLGQYFKQQRTRSFEWWIQSFLPMTFEGWYTSFLVELGC